MALKNRIGTAVYEYDGDVITLRAELDAINALVENTGIPFYEYMTNHITDPQSMAKIFYYFQSGSDYSENEIYAAFFSDIEVWQDSQTTEKLAKVGAILMGVDYQKRIKDVKGNTKKKPEPQV
ncbi:MULTISPECIES: hypothetical protein [unclassified Sphingopyxis]|uniref:hypothetical protein n=1 Tax=unclassified Sphingopyxis TaxID=2614943 RepID=UPI00073169D8|nr:MULTISPECIES: hypothetical protein [unclassified Sphingopyxis]KTE27413.1 hypothetical protein ATE61_05570 [Sphingopyxis sp. H057]KTE54716.1 hypothetical protein ATE64_05565 [Sphingopyxis sp. H073]KTE57042.1 hypothetical protein ATE69_05550 [Sphingopyxis sp. H071]KTE60119.1 hypothetical protein ATE66_09570 [Sphingopyxis sp. H107]KTE67593.1 hypothetical protein ATE60_19180 [Sphingopyxis sp. H081]